MDLSRLTCLLSVLFAVGLASDRQAIADWPQWRGPNRTGHVESAALIDDLPTDGLKAALKFDSFAGGTSGGWSSPVIVGDRVFAYSHTKIENENANLAKAKYPWLPPDKRTGEDGLSKSEKIWQEKAVKSGPLACSTPAFSDGRMVLRLRDAIICFDLRK